jgi:hypothetical protein
MKAIEKAKQVEKQAEGFWSWLLGSGGRSASTNG